MQSIAESIGQTPLVELKKYAENRQIPARLLAKVEGQNPGGSAKDRPALAMLKAAEARGELHSGGHIIEATSGNTGVALAMLAGMRGYRCTIVLPEDTHPARIRLMQAYGAETVLTPAAAGMAGAVERAEVLARENGAYMPRQFCNPTNPLAHFRTTGPEIWADVAGQMDTFVAGIGTGGTVTGVGRFLKMQNPAIQVIGVWPEKGESIPGIGANFTPDILDLSVVDAVLRIPAKEAQQASKDLARTEGILAGPSSGATLAAAGRIAKQGIRIVVLLPDRGERYL